VIVDTAGRLYTTSNLMDELIHEAHRCKNRAGAVAADVLRVMARTTGQNGLREARRIPATQPYESF